MPWTMYNQKGLRKYLTKSERELFLLASLRKNDDVKNFCWMVAVTGCRISEALSINDRSIDFETKQVVIESLKKRGKQVFRSVPLPNEFLKSLRYLIKKDHPSGERLWPWSRMTGYRRIREVMDDAGIVGPQATPKGLRHAFGVCAIQSKVPLNMVQRWLGHADIKTTSIYTSAMGPEERAIASLMWDDSLGRSLTESKNTKVRQKEKPIRQESLYEARRKGTHNFLSPQDKPITTENELLINQLESFENLNINDKQNNDSVQADCFMLHFWLNCASKPCCRSSTSPNISRDRESAFSSEAITPEMLCNFMTLLSRYVPCHKF